MDIINGNHSADSKQKYYQQLVKSTAPAIPVVQNALKAFGIGGLICTVGQLFIMLFEALGLEKLDASAAASSTLVLLTIILTGLGVFDEITRVAGAGSIVPITGFANSMAAPALEHRAEGFVFGVAARMFEIAGPVIVYGLVTSWIIGLIYYFVNKGGM